MSDFRGRGWRDSPMIREAMKERDPADIAVLTCDQCRSLTYYNEGSHCNCEHCDASLDHLLGETGDVITLADVFDAEAEYDAGSP